MRRMLYIFIRGCGIVVLSFSDVFCLFFFFNDTATTEIYTLSLHDALPISGNEGACQRRGMGPRKFARHALEVRGLHRSEEHTSELQSQSNLVCRLLLEKKKNRGGAGTLPSRISGLARKTSVATE